MRSRRVETTDRFTGLSCTDCGGILDPTYDYDRIDVTPEDIEARPFESMWRYAELLPFDPDAAVSLGEGATPLVDCPALADDEVETACNGIAIPDPGASPLILDAAITVARTEGLEVGATCAAAASGAFALAKRGELGPDDTVVLLNTGAGNKDVDALRAHLGEREGEAEGR